MEIQLKPDIKGLRRSDRDPVDGSDGAHNPKVAGSNPAPATKK